MQNWHTLSLGDLRLLCAVADAGSMSAAAESLGYTQSGVSRRVAALEVATGVELLTRRPRGVRLTEAGERLRFHAARILETAALAVRELDPQRTSPPLRIGAFSTANATIVPAVLARLATAHPELSVTVRDNRSVGLLRGLVSGSLDVAVVSDYPASPPSQASIRLERVTDDPFVVALPIRHPLLGGRFSLRDLASSPWIEGDRAETPVLVAAAANAGFEPYIVHRVRDWHTKLAYVATGLGCALVPGLAAASPRPDVAFRRLSEELPARRVSLAMSTTSAADDAALDAFSAAVRGVVHEVAQRV